MKNREPIGVFDSGVGGISVLRQLVEIMPNENYIYMGDSKNAPYGTKKLEQVRTLTIENVETLLAQGVKSIVVACNTATSAAVAQLRKQYPKLPLVGIEPAIKPAVMENPGGQIVVMATPMTLCQEKFHRLLARYQEMARIISLPCPGLMEFVEQGILEGAQLEQYLSELFRNLQIETIDGIVLGCTHYPFIRQCLRKIVGDSVKIYDGGNGTAREMKRRLSVENMLSDAKTEGKIIFYNSLDTKEERELCEYLLYAGNRKNVCRAGMREK